MPTFTYHARDESGRLVKGILEAESRGILADRLKKMGYMVTRMEEAPGFPSLKTLWLARSVDQETLLLASLQLANLVEAGVPLATSLKTVASQMNHPSFLQALEEVTREVEGGAAFSQALKNHPAIFPKLLVSLVQVGEASGHLDLVLTRFSNLVEKDLALTRQVRSALLYPCLLFVAAFALIIFVVTFVVPQFASVFSKAGIVLPLPTQILVALGQTIRSGWWILVSLGACVAVGGFFLSRVPQIRLKIDGALLKFPLLGKLIFQTLIARFARTLGTLVGAGVPILLSLETAKAVVENQVILQEIERVRLAVERGERIALTLSVGGIFASDSIQMIRVGEESGRLDGMLEKVADFYELRVGYAIKQMTTLLEPILLVAMGCVVAFIMASLLLPMFDMVKVLQAGGLR